MSEISNMKKFELLFTVIVTLFIDCLLLSCSNGQDNSQIETLQTKIDSLTNVAESSKSDYEHLQSFVSAISTSLDSIAMAENSIFDLVNPENKISTKDHIKKRIETFGELIARQRNIINKLSDSINAKNPNPEQIEKLNSIITYLNKELDNKDAEIAKMKTILKDRNRNIAQLKNNVSNLQNDVSNLEKKNELLTEVAAAQDEILNVGYIKIGSKKELLQAGILKGGGFLKKSKLDYSSFEAAGFQKIDIRHFKEYRIQSKKVKILTSVPSNSYSLIPNPDGTSTLVIKDPSSFWSISNYLVIQIN